MPQSAIVAPDSSERKRDPPCPTVMPCAHEGNTLYRRSTPHTTSSLESPYATMTAPLNKSCLCANARVLTGANSRVQSVGTCAELAAAYSCRVCPNKVMVLLLLRQF